eukprot:14420806-Alexandrium_andersonii.AAC.1
MSCRRSAAPAVCYPTRVRPWHVECRWGQQRGSNRDRPLWRGGGRWGGTAAQQQQAPKLQSAIVGAQ